MNKIAFLFPGQASQYVGMAKDLYDHSEIAREIFDESAEILNYNIKSICFSGPEEELKQTRITQPAIYIHSIILTKLFSDVKPDMAAGHSLGEYSAIVSAQACSFSDGLNLVSLRGALMQAAGEKNKGTMAAIIGLGVDNIKEICYKSSEFGIVQPANYNSSDQTVISGSIPAVRKAMEIAKDAGAKIVKELIVSGAFHSPLMQSAKEGLKEALDKITFKDTVYPIYSNVNAESSTNGEELKSNLDLQVSSPVLWFETIKNMEKDGAGIFIEIGPGKVLQGLVKRINPRLNIFGIDRFDDIGKISEQISRIKN